MKGLLRCLSTIQPTGLSSHQQDNANRQNHRLHSAADDFSCLEALGTDVGLVRMTIRYDGDLLDIGFDYAVSHAMRVADVTPGRRVLATDRTDLGHCKLLIHHLTVFIMLIT